MCFELEDIKGDNILKYMAVSNLLFLPVFSGFGF